MSKRLSTRARRLPHVCGLLVVLSVVQTVQGEAPPAAVAGFHAYSKAIENRLAEQHLSANAYLVPVAIDGGADARLRQGELAIARVAPDTKAEFAGALLHHWRGTAFARGATAADFEHVMRDFNSYPRYFAPEIVAAKVLARDGGSDAKDGTPAPSSMLASMRIRQKHVITVVMDATYDVTFGRLDGAHGYSISRSTEIREIGSPGSPSEHALSGGDEHGFLWRLNTYWSYEERDGGLYVQIEAVSLSRSIPRGLGWAIAPYVESIPRESLEFTLRAACNALRR